MKTRSDSSDAVAHPQDQAKLGDRLTAVMLHLSGAQLSDLFFNYEHPHRDELYKLYESQKDAPTCDELREAAFKDAVDFVETYQIPVEPTTLATDFQNRI